MTRRPYAAGVVVLAILLLSSALGAEIEWVDLGGNVDRVAPQQALQVPVGAAAVSPGTTSPTLPEQLADGMLIDYVYLFNNGTGGNYIPWWGLSYSAMRVQYLYLASEINKTGTIAQAALFRNYRGGNYNTFNNVSVKLCHTNLTSLTTNFTDNYGGNTPVWVFHAASLPRGMPSAGMWDTVDFATNFAYNGTQNLIIEVLWSGKANSTAITSYTASGSGNRRAYLRGDTASNTADGVDYIINSTRLGFLTANAPSSIAGTAFSDDDGDGERDAGERGLPGWTVKLEPGPRYTLTDANGAYRFRYLTAGEYTVSEVVKNYWQLTYPPSPGVHVVTLGAGQEVTGKDFGNQLYVFIQDVGVSVAGGIARAGRLKTYAVDYANIGTVEVDATVVLVLPPEVSYVSSNPPGVYDAVTHSVTWDVGSLPASFEGCLSAVVQIPVVPIGTELTASVTIKPLGGDANKKDNRDSETEVVIGSYDPNMITVRPDPYVEAGDVLDCTIYFQNVGNDTAFDIVVREVLDPGLDASTIEPLAASHPYAFGFGELNELIWTFNDIKLVDSITNEPASHGFLRFRIHTYPGLTPGTTIDNSAAIYFDFNDPVITNMVRLTVVDLGWTAQASMPLPPSNMEMAAGGWLAFDPGIEYVFAAKGNKTADFYAYDPTVDCWQTLPVWPEGNECDAPSDGAAGCANGNGYIYATKGNNTLGFWMYDAGADVWTQRKDVPLGPNMQRVKGGTDIVWVGSSGTGHAYLLKGGKNEFYRYYPDVDDWEALTDAPGGADRKWDKGSWLAHDGANTIYAHKAAYNELYAYDITTGTWSAPLAGMPFIGRSGKDLKSGDGGCGAYLDGCIYALKGDKTQEFWKYTIATNSWSEEDSLPLGDKAKPVGPGADIVTAGARLCATKGNESNELWQIFPGMPLLGTPQPGGVQAGKTEVTQGMSISPNPLANGLAVLRYGLPKAGTAELSVYNVTGQAVMAQTLIVGRSGSVNLDLRHLSNGVFMVKLQSQDFAVTRKLVIQR